MGAQLIEETLAVHAVLLLVSSVALFCVTACLVVVNRVLCPPCPVPTAVTHWDQLQCANVTHGWEWTVLLFASIEQQLAICVSRCREFLRSRGVISFSDWAV